MIFPYNGIFFSVIRRNEVLIHATTETNSENMLRKPGLKKKTAYCMMPFTMNAQN